MSEFQLLDKDNSALIFIDHQPQMTFGEANIDRRLLKNNVVGLAKAGKIFNVPTLFSAVETERFSGAIWPELLAVRPEIAPVKRTTMNVWEDAAFVRAVEAIGRKKLVISALWNEVLSDLSGIDGTGSRLRSLCGDRHFRRQFGQCA
ncbi:Uncharacterised protein [Serratia plymuthica]|uniref:Uncharacterized protein n=1 Tax=Serratia plymuthica TaxID=82996 RepID=A0A2X4U7M2_SERPL|nr:Uncharacterised protein [Serratia plymuthica]